MVKMCAVAVASLSAFAAEAWAAPHTYAMNKDHADVTFQVSHVGFTMKHGWFREMSGTLVLDEARPQDAKVDVRISAASIDTNHAQRDTELRGPNFLDAERFPDIRFVLTKVTRSGKDGAHVEGRISIHGVERPIILAAKLNKSAPNPFDQSATLGFHATAELRRSDFGVAAFLPAIGDTIGIVIDAEFSRKP